MKRLFAITTVLVLSSAIFFVAAGAGADMVTKPVKGKWSGIDYAVGFCTNGAIQSVNLGKGVSTGIGASDILSVSCLYCSNDPNDPSCESSGWMIVTAANGDALHLDSYATIGMSSGEWEEVEEVVGGTGRFKDATGLLTTKGNFMLPSDPDLFPFDADPSIPPSLLQPPSFWVGTTDGWITY